MISEEISRQTNYSTINAVTNHPKRNKLKTKYLNFIQENQTYFTGFIICAMSVMNITDRYVVSSVLIDVENYFDVSKSTAGLLQTVFLLSYMTFSPVNGYLGDRINRKYLLIFSILVWVTSTVSGSFVGPDQFYLFVLTRILFGVATASFEIIAVPIIGDRFADNHKTRNRVIILFCMGSPLGTGLSYLIGILAKDYFPDDWRYSMRITPFFLLFILIVILIGYVEPTRGAEKVQEVEQDESTIEADEEHCIETSSMLKKENSKPKSFLDDLNILFQNKTYILFNLTSTMSVGAYVAFSWWSPSLIDYSLRNQKLVADIDDFKKVYSILQACCGVLGLLVSYKLSVYLKKSPTRRVFVTLYQAGFFLQAFSFLCI